MAPREGAVGRRLGWRDDQALATNGEAWLQARDIKLPDKSHLATSDSSKIAGFVGGLASSLLCVGPGDRDEHGGQRRCKRAGSAQCAAW
jgi:hypothetical protein